MIRLSVLFIVFSALQFGFVFGDDDLTVSKKEWKVGYSRFLVDSDDPALQRAANLLPRLILDKVVDVQEHLVTIPEARHMAAEKITEIKNKSLSELERLYEERDNLIFSIKNQIKKYAELNRKIGDSLKTLKRRKKYRIEDSAVPGRLKVEFVSPDEDTKIFQIGVKNPRALFRSKSLDLLVAGTISSVGEYFAIVVTLYSHFQEKVLWEGVAGQNDFVAVAEGAANAMRAELLGRQWSGIDLQVEPVDAVIKVKDKIKGIGKWYDATLKPGLLEIEILANGRIPESRNIILESGVVKKLSVKLRKTVRPMVLIKSNPSGANVRISGVWKGITPLAVEVPSRIVSLGLEKKDYKKITMPMGSESKFFDIKLEKLFIEPEERYNLSRKKLNNSILFFSLSLAPTMISAGVSENARLEANLAASLNSGSQNAIAINDYNISNAILIGSVVLNLGTFTYMMFKLFDFFASAEGLND